jgi:hypothetical protein
VATCRVTAAQAHKRSEGGGVAPDSFAVCLLVREDFARAWLFPVCVGVWVYKLAEGRRG